MQKIRQALTPIALFLRFEYLTFALMLPILGATSVEERLPAIHVLWLLASALCFHVFISVQNDVFDLPLDRTDPRRINYPLVKGTVTVRFAVAFALVQIPLIAALVLIWGSNNLLIVSSVLTLAMMSIYNIWGKRTRFPILMDLVQGFGFAGMVLYGAATGGRFELFTWLAFLGVVIWMMQTNQLGGIRDLQSDYEFHIYTTPISLGSKCAEDGYFISRKSMAYSYLLLLMQLALPVTYLWREKDSLDWGTLISVFTFQVLILAVGARVLYQFFQIALRQRRIEMDLAYVVMYLSALPMLAVLALTGNPWVIITVAVILIATVHTYARVHL